MADNTTRLKILAQVEGVQGFDSLKRSLQGLAQQGQGTQRDLFRLAAVYKELKSGGDSTISGMRQQVAVLTQLRESVSTTGVLYKRWGAELDQVQGKLRALAQAERGAAQAAPRPGMGMAGALVTGGGIRGALSMQAGEAAMAGRLALAGGITAGMAAAAGAGAIAAGSVSTARDVATEQRKVSTLTNDTKALNDAIADLVRSQGYMTNQASATSAAYEILSSGFSRTGDVIKILNASTNGAVGGFSDIKTVADATTSILNGYGRSADDARRVVDMMIQTQNDGKIVVGEYAQSIGRLVPMAATANISLEEVNGAISALTAQGVPVESTFAGISQAIKSIIKPTDEARQMAAKLGLDFSASALSAKGFGGFLADVTAKTKGNSAALSILFSDIDGYKAVVALTNDKLKRFNEFTVNQAKAINASSIAAKKAVDPFEQYANANKDLGNAMGKILLPPLTKVTQLTTNLIKALMTNGLPERMKGFGEFMKGAIINTLPGGALLQSGSNLLDLNVEPPPPPPKDRRTDLPKPKPILPPQKTEDKAITDLANSVLSGGAGKFEPSSRAQALINAAKKLGVSPLDLATIISFETSGTFSPSIVGGEANKYQGLIQFGPPERAQYGMNRQQTFEEQVQGPVVRYFQDRFAKAGMSTQGAGLLKLYTTVLTGSPSGSPNAKDVFETSPRSGVAAMGPHRQRALQMFFGGKLENVGYSMAQAGEDISQGFEATQKLAEQRAKEQRDTFERNKDLEEQRRKSYQDSLNEYRLSEKDIALAGIMTSHKRLELELEKDLVNLRIQRQQALESSLDEEGSALIVERFRNKEAARRLQYSQDLLELNRGLMDFSSTNSIMQSSISAELQKQADAMERQRNMAEGIASTIGQGFSQAFDLAIQGSEDWKRSLSEIASGVLRDIAKQLIQIAVINTITKAVTGMISPTPKPTQNVPGYGSAGFLGIGTLPQGSNMPLDSAFSSPDFPAGFVPEFATGGIMTPQGAVPLRRYARGGIATAPQAAIYGEGATPEAFVPLPDGRRIPVALRQYPGIPGAPGTGGSFEQTDAVVQRLVETARQESAVRAATGSAAGPDGTMRIQIETTRINSVDYVTAEQAQALAQAAATRSTARQQRALQGSPAARRSVGI